MKESLIPIVLLLASCTSTGVEVPVFDELAVAQKYPALAKMIVRAEAYQPPRADPASTKEAWLVDEERTLQAGMKVKLDVLGHPELGNTYVIPEHGRVDVPHVRQVQLAGRTLGTVKEELERKLGEFVTHPQVVLSVAALEVTEDREGSVDVVGMVQTPGGITVQMRGEKPGQPGPAVAPWTLFMARLKAGGFKPGAAITQILILRHDRNRSRVVNIIVTDWDAFEKTRHPVYNVRLQPGDIVIVPRVYPEDQNVAAEFEWIQEYVQGRVDRNGFLSRLR